ncbi:MAG: CatB-related O-acetyltransferase [Zetaproteobacteria bacterium]|nr:CatB-related O-acetyltransferase [Zetaproteobacteria bacterium]
MRLFISALSWIFIRRFLLKQKTVGFSAHWNTRVNGSCTFSEFNKLLSNTRIYNSTLGCCTYIGGAEIRNSDIGSFCSIASQARIGGLGSHPVNFISTHPIFYSLINQVGFTFASENKVEEQARTTVGNDVWVGYRAVILDGVTVGDGAVIAAGAVVTKDIEPYSIVGGVPAKLIRKRFDDEVIEKLLEIKWWNLSPAELENVSSYFISRTSWNKSDIIQLQNKLGKSK